MIIKYWYLTNLLVIESWLKIGSCAALKLCKSIHQSYLNIKSINRLVLIVGECAQWIVVLRHLLLAVQKFVQVTLRE